MATKKAKQERLIPHEETSKFPAVSKAAEKYREIRDERMQLTEDESAAHDALLALLDKHGLSGKDYYLDDGSCVYVDEKRRVKVRKKKPTEEERAEEAEKEKKKARAIA